MKIIRLLPSEFDLYKNEIVGFMKEVNKYSFPDSVFDSEYLQKEVEKVHSYLNDGSAIIFIALSEDNIPQGWLWCHEIQRIDQTRLHIANIAVKSEFRKNGIGRELISFAEKYAYKMKYAGVDLLVTVSNKDAIDFYKCMGFIEERIQLKKELIND